MEEGQRAGRLPTISGDRYNLTPVAKGLLPSGRRNMPGRRYRRGPAGTLPPQRHRPDVYREVGSSSDA